LGERDKNVARNIRNVSKGDPQTIRKAVIVAVIVVGVAACFGLFLLLVWKTSRLTGLG
jgi:hypothetical protein